MTCWHARVSPWLVAVAVFFAPCRGWAYDDEDAGPVCDESRAILAGEESDCDGVLIGPKRLGQLLEDRERLSTCNIDLRLSRDLLRIDGERCDGRLRLLTEALDKANAKLREPPAWQWQNAVFGVALGLVLGAGVTAWVATR